MENFITIARFTYPSEYVIIKLLLQQATINYVFLNETAITILPFHSNAFGGIRLQVHKNDKEKAIKIINNLKNDTVLEIV
ncbi:MAG: DUF2007 domain-containing protein [Flavobacteriales bacterium]|jgi:hypothetical protein